METSMRSMMKRTNKPIRPWVQGFWYRSAQIAAQIDGIENAMGSSWSVWSPTGRYELYYQAMADRTGKVLTRPKYYSSVAELISENDRSIRGHSAIVNYTSFKSGYSILSLEASEKGKPSRYFSPASIVATLEESIMDHILKTRKIPCRTDAEPCTKRKLISDLLCRDLGKDERRMRPQPIYIDWAHDCRFSTEGIPQPRLDIYAQATRQAPTDNSAGIGIQDSIDLASISESMFGVVIHPTVIPPISVFPQ